ncbi:MAG TPA: anaerobic ribonucleoside-triphosphate reductase activating protein [Clostridia bacterium]|nr:anaerobic ribonucleoside-triphosphate reductase activating protein [Clostridia bacterium]
MNIAGLQRSSTVDFPKRYSAVIFAAGCNFRCFYCHNRAILDRPPLLLEAEVSAFLEKRAGLIDGVVFSGGEPTLQKDLAWWLNRAKKLGYAVKLDTNGSRPEVLANLLAAGLVDYVAMDYKAPFLKYSSLCLAPPKGVKESLELLLSSNVEFELRTTVVPQLALADLFEMARTVPSLPRWSLQLYREQPGDRAFLGNLEPYRPEEIRGFAEKLRTVQLNVAARA